MTNLNPLPKSKLVQFALKVHQVSEQSWWVYRYEIGARGQLSINARVVFFGQSQAETERWLVQQAEEATIYMLSDN